jgi:hypothetical protein
MATGNQEGRRPQTLGMRGSMSRPWWRWVTPGRWGHRLGVTLVGAGLALGTPPPLTRAAEVEPWQYLSENTALVLLLDTTPDTWGQLSQFQLFKLLADEQGIVPGLPGLPYLPYGIDFAREIAPWVGDTAVVALLPASPGELTPMADHTVMVAPVTDPEAFARFRATFLEQQAGDPEITPAITPEIIPALGIDIYFWPGPVLEDSPDLPIELPIPQACGPAEVGAAPCVWDAEGEPKQLDKANSDAGKAEPSPPQARPVLRLNGGVGLPLTVSPLSPDPGATEEFEIDVPVPLPSFGPGGLAVAFLPDALVTAETPAAIEQYLRLRQAQGTPPGQATPPAQTSLADSQAFQRTLANRQQARAFVAVYGNALELLNYDLSATTLPDLGLPLPPTPSLDADTLQTLRSLSFGGTLEALVYPLDQGVQVRGRYYYDAVPFTFGLTPTVPEADSPLAQLPAATFLVLSGRDVAGFWRSMSTVLERASDVTREGLATVRSAFTLVTGLDLEQDLLAWMDGEVAIAAFPTDGGPLAYAGLGLLLQTSDRPAAERALAAVDAQLPGFGLTANPRIVNRQPVTSWELFSSWNDDDYVPELSMGSYGWVTDDTLAITSGVVPMARVLAPSPHDPLADFFLFDQATANFPTPNNGYFYLNMGATLALAYQVFGGYDGPVLDAVRPYVGSVRSLSATTAQTPDYMEAYGQLGLAPRRD